MARKGNKIKKIINSKFVREHKKLSIGLVVCLCFLGLFITINYGRYVKNIIEVYYLRTQNFYFSSDKLTINGKSYEIEPWEGKLAHDINISMSSLLNSLKGTTEDIKYTVSCTADSVVDCYIVEKLADGTEIVVDSTQERTIKASSNADNFVIRINPKESVVFKDGDRVKVSVKAESTFPYEEELSADFTLIIGNYGIKYVIEDTAGDVYFDAIVTNTFDTDTATITLDITDLSLVSIDMTNNILSDSNTQIVTEKYTIDGKESEYIKKIIFDLAPKSSMMVRYFKTDENADYSYSISEENISPIVAMSKTIK